MPTYTFFNEEAGVEFDLFMSIAEREQYLKDNPKITQMPSAPALVGDHVMGRGPKVDGGFTENMQRIAESHPGTPLADRYGSSSTRSTKEIKTREVLKKHGVL